MKKFFIFIAVCSLITLSVALFGFAGGDIAVTYPHPLQASQQQATVIGLKLGADAPQPKKNQGIWIETADSNYYNEPQNPSIIYYPENLFDNLTDTAWGTDTKTTSPVVTVGFHLPVSLASISIKNGKGEEGSDDYRNNGRVKKAQLKVGQVVIDLALADTSAWQTFTFPQVTGDSATLTITDSYPGAKWFTIFMSEVSFNLPESFGTPPQAGRSKDMLDWLRAQLVADPTGNIYQFKSYGDAVLGFIQTAQKNGSLPVPSDPVKLKDVGEAYLYYASESNKVPLSLGFPRTSLILSRYNDAYGAFYIFKAGVTDAYSPSYFFTVVANALQPFTAMMAKSYLLNHGFDGDLSNASSGFKDELLLHYLVLGMGKNSDYYYGKYKGIKKNGLPMSGRVVISYYRFLRSLRASTYAPVRFYETVMLEDAFELPKYCDMLAEMINDKAGFIQKYLLPGGSISQTMYDGTTFMVASVAGVEEFDTFAISMYLHHADLIAYFKALLQNLPYDDSVKKELSRILLDMNYYAAHPERQYY